MKSKVLIQIVVLVTLLLIPITAFSTSTDWGYVDSGTWSRFYGIWGSSATDIYVTSYQRYNFETSSHENYGQILHSNGLTWHSETLPTNPQPLYRIWGSSATNIFTVGASGTILRYTGGWYSMTSGTTNNLYGVCGSSASNVFAVGASGTIRKYNGSSWSSITSGTSNQLNDVWCDSTGTNVFVVGLSGTIVHYNGTSWHLDTSGISNDLYGVWGSSASDVFAVGLGGKILHFNGTSWSSMSGASVDLFAVWGTANNNVYAGGGWGVILHYNGSSWSSMTNWATNWVIGIWGSSTTDVYAAEDWGAISHYPSYSISGSVKTAELSPVSDVQIWYYSYNGSFGGWTFVTTDGSGNYTIPNLGPGIYTIYPGKTGYTFSPSYLQVTISGASVSGKNFTATPIPYSISGTVTLSTAGLSGVTMMLYGSISATTLTDASGNYTLRNLSNGSYTVTPDKAGYTFTPSNLPVTISGASASGKNFSATFTGGALGWVTMGSGTTNHLLGVWGSSPADVFAVGDAGTIRHYNGTSWDTSNSGITTALYGVWGSSATNVFAAAWEGEIIRYNGTSWNTVLPPSGTWFNGIWGSSATDVFAVGEYMQAEGFRYNGSSWSEMTGLPIGTHITSLEGVWGIPGFNVFAVGLDYDATPPSGLILRYQYTGGSWSSMTSGTGNELKGVWGSSATDVFAVGLEGTILHFNGTSWSPMTSGTGNELKGVWGSSGSDVFAVGNYGTIIHTAYLHSISGTVSGDTKQDVTMSLSDPVSKSTKTDSSGYYKFSLLSNGTYTLTPSKTNYTFTPTSTQVEVSGADVTGVSFVATEKTYCITGTVTGEIQDGVTMTLSGSLQTTTTTTHDSGIYSFTGVKNGAYTVTPSKDGYYFDPTNIKVTVSGADKPGQNFTSAAYHSISGAVTLSSGSIGSVEGVTIMMVYESVSGDTTTTTTNASGNYSFAGLKKGTYTVTPSKICYSFTPTNSKVTISGADVTVNFTATPLPCWSIAGTVSGAMLGGVTMTLSGSVQTSTLTDSLGNYTFRGLRNGTYTITPIKTGYVFSPPFRKVIIFDGPPPIQLFTSSPALTYSISGTVSLSTVGLSGVTMTLSGTSLTTTTTDASGNYSFTGLYNGPYIVTPSKPAEYPYVYVFNPSNSPVTISGANKTGVNFVATKIITVYSISGTVTGDILAGVTMTLSGSNSGTTLTDASGNYTFRTLTNGSYTVTPSKTNYTFTPTSRQVTISGANVIGADFTATGTFTISGTVTGDIQAGVTMTLSGSMSGTTLTDASGNYTFRTLINGTYTVTASKTNYTFTPPSRQVTISGANVIGVNFTATAYTISGTVTLSGSGLSGVTMTLSGTSSGITTTVASGNYSFTGLYNGTYTVTPNKTNYTFTPTSRQVTISGASVTGVNFTATGTFTISGTVSGDTQADVTMSLFGSVSTTTITDASGNYRFTGISNGTYTITPRKSGYSFELPYRQVTISGANVIGADFTAHIASTYTISGTVTGDTQADVTDVTITILYDSVLGDTTTNTSGNYTFSGLSNGTYTVTPSKANYTFSPSSTQVTISDADVTGVNFVATVVGGCSTWAEVYAKYEDYVKGEITWAELMDCYQEYSSTFSISGTVTGNIQAGVTMTLSGDISAITTTTDSSGNYTFSGLSNGSYIVEPSLSNYTFSPASTQVTVSEADVTGVNFVATALGGCSTWADVNAKYEDYVSGEITWAEFFSCYQEYTTQ